MQFSFGTLWISIAICLADQLRIHHSVDLDILSGNDWNALI